MPEAYTIDRGHARYTVEQVVIPGTDRRIAADIARPIFERRAAHLGKVSTIIPIAYHETHDTTHQPAIEVTARVFYEPE